MFALRIDTPAQDSTSTRVIETEEPVPGPGQVSIAVSHAGINFTDVMARRGDPGYAPDGWPVRPGLEVAGTIRALGPGVDQWQVGDRVAALVASGGLAEVAVADSSVVARIPDDLDPAMAAAAPLMVGTAICLVQDAARLRPGERVFMHAAGGGVGSVVPQVAGYLGSGPRVGSVRDQQAAQAARSAGWDDALVASEHLAEQAVSAAGGHFDVILDPTGTTSLDVDLELAAPGARVVLFGNATGGTPAPLPAFGRLLGGNLGLIGFSMTGLLRQAPHRVSAALTLGLTLLAEGRIRPPITVVDSLAEVGGIHDLLVDRAGSGKYVVRVRS